MEALAPKVTIAGQEVSTATEFLELVDGTFTDADVETLKQLGSLKRIYLDGVTIETEDLSWVAQFPKLTEFSCEGYLMDELDLTPFAGLTGLERLTCYSVWTYAADPAGLLSERKQRGHGGQRSVPPGRVDQNEAAGPEHQL